MDIRTYTIAESLALFARRGFKIQIEPADLTAHARIYFFPPPPLESFTPQDEFNRFAEGEKPAVPMATSFSVMEPSDLAVMFAEARAFYQL